jgi:purine nucleosidase
MSYPIYLDTDLGIDDAMALAYLLASPEALIVGIGTVHGNVSAEQAARNTLDFLGLADRLDIPVALGAGQPLESPFDGGAPHIHGQNGVGDLVLPHARQRPVAEPAEDMILRLSHEFEGTLRIVAIGPLTNLALALARDSSLPARVHSVYVMGGAALVPGNISAVAEANIAHDPEAAQVALGADWAVVLAPLDITMEHRLTPQQRAKLAGSGWAPARAIADMLDVYVNWYLPIFGTPDVALHDPLAAALAIDAITVGSAPKVDVEVDTTLGPGRGQLICDLRGRFVGYPPQPDAHVTVVLAVEEDFSHHLVERLSEGRPHLNSEANPWT